MIALFERQKILASPTESTSLFYIFVILSPVPRTLQQAR